MNTSNEDEMLKNFCWIVWIFTMTGIVLTILLTTTTGSTNSLLVLFKPISIYSLLISVFCFPLLVFLVMVLQKNRYLSLIQFQKWFIGVLNFNFLRTIPAGYETDSSM